MTSVDRKVEERRGATFFRMSLKIGLGSRRSCVLKMYVMNATSRNMLATASESNACFFLLSLSS